MVSQSSPKKYEYSISDINIWLQFYQEQFPPKYFMERFPLNANDVPDSAISMNELKFVLTKCKSNKCPGRDSIPFEFYRNLPKVWEQYILNFFELLMTKEKFL